MNSRYFSVKIFASLIVITAEEDYEISTDSSSREIHTYRACGV